MSRPAKSSQSGLGAVKRDWSQSNLSQPSQEIPWSSSPGAPVQPKPIDKHVEKKLTPSEIRLKAIQEALAGVSSSSSSKASPPLAHSSLQNKRLSSYTNDATAVPPPKRARQLPPDWHNSLTGQSLSKPSVPSASSSLGASSKSAVLAPSSAPGASIKTKLASIFLSQEQTQILKLVQDGESVFYTGSAGTGKSVLLREIIKALRKKYVKTADAVAITASTGIAACNIGGVTIHSFAGIGLGIESAEDLVNKIKKNKKASTRWLRTKVLIIDEVSMLDGVLFDKLAKIGSILRKRPEPFGGIQIVVTGDFFQLPPVTKGEVKFAFEADMWKETVKHTYNLTKVFRQSDQTFVDMLNEMRFGTLSAASIEAFRRLSRDIEYDDGLGPTELFPRREDVERSNSTRMTRLQTHEEVYTSVDSGTIQDPTQREKMLANFMAPQKLTLRIDAQVMLIKNHDDTLVNGSMGRVIRFVDPAVYGTELDEGFSGEANVVGAASATGGVGSATKEQNVASVAKTRLYPVVEFILPHGGKRRMLIMPEVWKVELPSGEIQISRTQLPLILSWAMSIHKSQGQTLDRVKVDLGKVFEKGQAYVALSRATTLDGLQVLNFNPSKVQAHYKVVAWSKTLSTIADR